VTLTVVTQYKRLETGEYLTWPHLALVTALSASSTWGALIAVLQTLFKSQSLAFDFFLATGLLPTPTALVVTFALIFIHGLTSTTIFHVVVALSWPAHPCEFGAPSGDAVVPVVGRLGSSPGKVVIDHFSRNRVRAWAARIAAAGAPILLVVPFAAVHLDALAFLFVSHAFPFRIFAGVAAIVLAR